MTKPPPKLVKRPEDPPPPDWAIDPDGLLPSRAGHYRIGLTGGIASGKSTIAELLVAFGASIIDFDILSKKILEPEADGWNKTIELLGPKIKLPDGQLNRPLIAKRIFKDKQLRLALENIIHPLVWNGMLKELKNLDVPVVIIDIPLLYEANLASLFHPVVLCFASPFSQFKRLRDRNPDLGRRAAKRRLASQWPMTEKIRRGAYIINNEGSLAQMIRQTKALWKLLISDQFPLTAGKCQAGGSNINNYI